MSVSLPPASVERYAHDGILFPIPVLSTTEVTEYRHALESVAAMCGEGYRRRFDNLHLFFPWAYRLATNEAVLNAVEGILGPDIVVDATLVFYKPPYDGGYAAWHQDSVYSNWHLTPAVSAWIALTASEPANGCMRVVPGTHQEGVREHDTIVDDPDLMNRRGERVRVDINEAQAVDVILQPGEMSLHHANIVHGSNANGSDGPRIGFIVRFVTSQTTNRDRLQMQVRGNADCSHLRTATPPLEEDLAIAMTAWKAREPNSAATAGRG
ncbi:MAG TPA: phytanoyl-CoA dioxygenase family protein [Pyrinomonadaceae bacterium]|nr:phytanoyl-CoA dioxygenase family protein [Pyrinomonadaceae bacterium]